MPIPAKTPKKAVNCDRCPLHQTRTQVVWGEGPSPCDLAFLAEAPGAVENRTGRPLVGQAGQLFDELLDEVGIRRSEVYLANAIKCQLPGNQLSQCPQALPACQPWLQEELKVVKPKVLVLLGATAAIGRMSTLGVGEFCGVARVDRVGSRKVILLGCYHPSALARDRDDVVKRQRTVAALKVAKGLVGRVGPFLDNGRGEG